MSYVSKQLERHFRIQAVARKSLEICEENDFSEGEVDQLPEMIDALIKENRKERKFSLKQEKPAAEPEL